MSVNSKQNIVFIGAGNLATNLAIALFNCGYNIIQVFSRSQESAEKLSSKVNSSYTTSLLNIVQDADLYIISVPDKAVKEIVAQMPLYKGIVAHTSGSVDVSILSKYRENGYGVIYPFQTFSKKRIVPFENIPICIEANDNKSFDILNQIASSISNTIIRMDSNTRSWLHLTGVFTNNFTNHLLTLSQQISQEKGFDFKILKPLAIETIQKAFDISPDNAQTGPAVRFDDDTIKLHLEKLKEYSPELADIYKALTLSIQSTIDNKK